MDKYKYHRKKIYTHVILSWIAPFKNHVFLFVFYLSILSFIWEWLVISKIVKLKHALDHNKVLVFYNQFAQMYEN